MIAPASVLREVGWPVEIQTAVENVRIENPDRARDRIAIPKTIGWLLTPGKRIILI
jgi:hypothetical protein